MKNEQQRLKEMKLNNKISETDYQMLMRALAKKSIFENIEDSVLLNPFKKLAGLKALFLGILLIIILSVFGSYLKVYFDGALGFIAPVGLKVPVKPNFLLLLYQNVIACLSVSLVFLAAALLFKQKNIRVIDFFGTVALARFPLLISLFAVYLEMFLDPEFSDTTNQGIQLHFRLDGILFNFIIFACLAWQILTYFFAYQESSGLTGKKLLISFIILLMISDSIAMPLTRWFLYT